jgi:diguanylate cyclase (GGDEF)-like protein/PAS domain S-box-containing protein/putative nucleotidyltransferase with HDIG domain
LWPLIDKYAKVVFFSVVVIATVMALVIVWKLHNVQMQIDATTMQVNKTIKISEIKENILQQSLAINSYMLSKENRYLEEFRSYTPINTSMQQELTEVIRESRKPAALQLKASYNEYIQTCEKYIVPSIAGGKEITADIKQKIIYKEWHVLELAAGIQSLRQQDTQTVMYASLENSRSATRTAKSFTLVGVFIGLILSITMGSRFIKNHKLYNGILRTTRNITITIDEKGGITSVNHTAQDVFGIGDEVINKNYNDILGKGKLIEIELPLARVIATGIGICNLERPYADSDGWKCALNVDCLPLDNSVPSGVLIVARDISERKILEEKLYAMTLRDGLTGLYNQSYLKNKLREEVDIAVANNQQLAFFIMDIDDFKFYNDWFGHLAGDEFLYRFGQLINKCVRGSDILGRYGGDEFAVILPGAGRETAQKLADRLCSSVESHTFPNRNIMPRGKITVSLGIAVFPDNAQTAEQLITVADEDMYRCKRRLKSIDRAQVSVTKNFQNELKETDVKLYNAVQTVLGIIRAKDMETYMHLEKVADFTGLLCRNLNLNEEQSRDVKLAALLHDVGKIEIPRYILNKIGQLTSEEWSIVKQHPKWGAEMVQTIEKLEYVVYLILHHHERFDGKGYPERLKGDQIPLGSRIISVVDSFDAMTNVRPYRKPKDFFSALKEIEKYKGTQFDPDIADIFIKAVTGLQDNYGAMLFNEDRSCWVK